MNRTTSLLTLSLSLLTSAAFAQSCATSVTGASVPGMAELDQIIQSVLKKYDVPGGALAVSAGGRLVFARGYGCADTASNTPAQPESLFRLASVSKTFTAIGILQLYQQGKLSLDDSVFGSILTDYQPMTGQSMNPNLLKITVRNLLQHTGGWDRGVVHRYNGQPYGDPIDFINGAATALGAPLPGTCPDVIRFMLSQPLDHPPGTFYAYSNLGYCTLGRVIEYVSGMRYEQYVQQNILKPLGIGRQKLAATLQSDRANGEVTYYDFPGAPLVKSVFPDVTAVVPAAYGGHFMESVDSTGEWASSAVELVRFLNGIDGKRGGPLLTPATIQTMQIDPMLQNEGSGGFYGLGFAFQKLANGQLRWTKDGALPGTSTYVVHSPTFNWAVLFNSAPSQSASNTASEDGEPTFENDYVNQIESALGRVMVPSIDQFPNFASTLLTPTLQASNPVVQGATFQPGIVSGSWVTIRGQNLATATRQWWADEFNGNKLPTEIDHVRVTINEKDASVYYVSPTQLNVQAPADTATGTVNVRVIRDGTPSAVVQAQLQNAAPGFFTYGSSSQLFLAAVHLDGVVIGDAFLYPGTRPAKPGEIVELYATALAPSQGGVIPDSPLALAPLPTVTVGGTPAIVHYAGLTGAGLYQINVMIPQFANRVSGNLEVRLTYGGVTSPPGAAIPVSSP